jgi:hypothetical protein
VVVRRGTVIVIIRLLVEPVPGTSLTLKKEAAGGRNSMARMNIQDQINDDRINNNQTISLFSNPVVYFGS